MSKPNDLTATSCMQIDVKDTTDTARDKNNRFPKY